MNNLRPANVALVVATAGVLLSTLIAALFASLTRLYLLVNAALLFGLLFGLTFLIMRRYIDAQLRSVRRIVHGDVSKSRDSIERAKAEAALWQTDQQNEMERLRNNDQYRKEFVANVTHELKTPLFNIQGYVHSLLDGALEDDGVNRLFLNKAARNVDRLATLVADLETITQLETGGAVFQPEVFDLAALVHDVFEQLEIKAAEKQKT
ncbi:MAG TPA: histidine kinase dimerization/phospho-acceptor domain-containing protein, partial [Chitinophagales bacterium]|nr:histidine kinase dimerization/phospho-acceptor domain-containing protein [Chitinophagales bacterium]